MITVVTGPKGSGKSTYLINHAEEIKAKGIMVGGVISRGFWKNNEREYYDAVDPASGISQLLASKNTPSNTENLNILHRGPWYFHRQTFAMFNERINQFIKNYLSGNKQAVLYIDEIGEIELANEGWDIGNFIKLAPPELNFMLGVRQSILDRLGPVWGIEGRIIELPLFKPV